MKMVFIVGAIQIIRDTLRGRGSRELSFIMFKSERLGLGNKRHFNSASFIKLIPVSLKNSY